MCHIFKNYNSIHINCFLNFLKLIYQYKLLKAISSQISKLYLTVLFIILQMGKFEMLPLGMKMFFSFIIEVK